MNLTRDYYQYIRNITNIEPSQYKFREDKNSRFIINFLIRCNAEIFPNNVSNIGC